MCSPPLFALVYLPARARVVLDMLGGCVVSGEFVGVEGWGICWRGWLVSKSKSNRGRWLSSLVTKRELVLNEYSTILWKFPLIQTLALTTELDQETLTLYLVTGALEIMLTLRLISGSRTSHKNPYSSLLAKNLANTTPLSAPLLVLYIKLHVFQFTWLAALAPTANRGEMEN